MGWSASPMQRKSSCNSNRKGSTAAQWQLRPNSFLVSEWPTPNPNKGFLTQFSYRTMWDLALLMVKALIWGVSSVFPALQLLPWGCGEAATANPGLTHTVFSEGCPPATPRPGASWGSRTWCPPVQRHAPCSSANIRNHLEPQPLLSKILNLELDQALTWSYSESKYSLFFQIQTELKSRLKH